MSTKSESCVKNGHKYMPCETQREIKGQDTILFTTFYCEKCCDVQIKETGIWKNFIPNKQTPKGKEF